MNKEISSYKNLGTLKFFLHILNFIENRGTITLEEIKDYYYNKLIDNVYIIDGPLYLLEIIGIISIENNYLSVSKDVLGENLQELITTGLLKYISNNEIYESILQSNHIIFVDGNYFIKKSAFQLHFANIRNVLINLEFIHASNLGKPYMVDVRFHDILKKYIKHTNQEKVKKYTNQYVRNMELGEEAELYVMSFERDRLGGNNALKIEKVSDYDDSVGYDIASFESSESKTFDRHIEVKSFNGEARFYRSRNEVETAKQMGEEYYLYLVDRSKMNCTDYSPIIIVDPYKNIIKNDSMTVIIDTYQIIL